MKINACYTMIGMDLCILLMPQFQYAVSVHHALQNCILSYSDDLKTGCWYLLLSTAENFVWCKINNLPLVRLIILQPED